MKSRAALSRVVTREVVGHEVYHTHNAHQYVGCSKGLPLKTDEASHEGEIDSEFATAKTSPELADELRFAPLHPLAGPVPETESEGHQRIVDGVRVR
jgi:hypothetical protein